MKQILFITGILLVSIANSQVKTTTKAKTSVVTTKKPVIPTKKKVVAPPVIKKEPGTRVKISTDSGVIVIRLYDKTPLHRDNFIKIANEHFFDSLLFHRVIRDFMIQGGDPASKNAPAGQMLGAGGPGYTIAAEFDTTLFHKKGALAAARQPDQVNPLKESSGSQFYIVQGKKYSEQELTMMEQQRGVPIPSRHKLVYQLLGGTPFLDMNYTVFGEVESGLEVIDKISLVPKDGNNRPLSDLRMMVEVVKEPGVDKTKVKAPETKVKVKTPEQKVKVKTSK